MEIANVLLHDLDLSDGISNVCIFLAFTYQAFQVAILTNAGKMQTLLLPSDMKSSIFH